MSRLPDTMAVSRAVGVALLLSSAARADSPPPFARNVTTYHLNPMSAGALPVNMDTGDAEGDLYFYLGEFLLPLECANISQAGRAHFDCDNPERRDPDRVVTRVDLEIDARTTGYSACNLCNGTDPFSGKSCKKGTYTCDCFDHTPGVCTAWQVGVENVTDAFAPVVTTGSCHKALTKACVDVKFDEEKCYDCLTTNKEALKAAGCQSKDEFQFCPNWFARCNETADEWTCWGENIVRKTGGFWYSTRKEGQCADGQQWGDNCTWRVQSMKTINNTCMHNKLVETVEGYDKSGCFPACGTPRNTSSECWIGCFFDAVLGKEARHTNQKPLGGMPLEVLRNGWTDAFLPPAQGGCPTIDIPYTAEEVPAQDFQLVV
eukprot:TRINITY_DN80714_c0_g1_i1.p1 TRINITY_DN80714_c0_g1~~TRINITY_DN80714_c0_g1_i1.p1  ORF type:complete len:384 (+),score=62.56 TRINITY_DN80714_c0_g1_i1:28-1152(+)